MPLRVSYTGAPRPPMPEYPHRGFVLRRLLRTMRRYAARMRRAHAMTLVEVAMVVSIVMVLTALLLPAIGVVRQRAATAGTRALVQQVDAALGLYRAEDPRRRFPAMPTDRTLRLDAIAERLAERGLRVDAENTGAVDGGTAALVDAWDQALQYHLDDHAGGDGLARRPLDDAGEPVRVPEDVADWNPPRGSPARAAVPHAYVWSWGRPRPGQRLRAQAATWIYVAREPSRP